LIGQHLTIIIDAEVKKWSKFAGCNKQDIRQAVFWSALMVVSIIERSDNIN
jgi:hypothetical protein